MQQTLEKQQILYHFNIWWSLYTNPGAWSYHSKNIFHMSGMNGILLSHSHCAQQQAKRTLKGEAAAENLEFLVMNGRDKR